MNKTLKVVADRSYDDRITVVPNEFARSVAIEHPPGAQALKLMHLLIAHAGGDVSQDCWHEIYLSDIRKESGLRNHDANSLPPLFAEMRAVTIKYESDQNLSIGGFLDHADIDKISEDTVIKYKFATMFQIMVEISRYWTILDRQAIIAMQSKYSIRLFQHISSFINMDHKKYVEYPVSELRSVLGVPEGKLERWNDVNRYALSPAVKEVNELSRVRLTVKPQKRGKSIRTVKIYWEHKPDLEAIAPELEPAPPPVNTAAPSPALVAPAAGRLAFPESGPIKFGKEREIWRDLAEQHAKRLPGGHLPDTDKLSDDFRAFCASRNIPLNAPTIEKTFMTFCKKYTPIMGGS